METARARVSRRACPGAFGRAGRQGRTGVARPSSTSRGRFSTGDSSRHEPLTGSVFMSDGHRGTEKGVALHRDVTGTSHVLHPIQGSAVVSLGLGGRDKSPRSGGFKNTRVSSPGHGWGQEAEIQAGLRRVPPETPPLSVQTPCSPRVLTQSPPPYVCVPISSYRGLSPMGLQTTPMSCSHLNDSVEDLTRECPPS